MKKEKKPFKCANRLDIKDYMNSCTKFKKYISYKIKKQLYQQHYYLMGPTITNNYCSDTLSIQKISSKLLKPFMKKIITNMLTPKCYI